MHFLTEDTGFGDIEVVTESVGDKKVTMFTGPFLEAVSKNRNGRIYPKALIEREVKKYQTHIKEGSAVGELDHPTTGPNINSDRISHIVTEMAMDGNVAIGTAKLLDTPCGKIAQTLLESGVKMGVSSRGLGSLGANNMVNSDFDLVCVDIVQRPSALSAYVQLAESLAWEFDEQAGMYIQKAVGDLQETSVKRSSSSEEIRNAYLNVIDILSKKL